MSHAEATIGEIAYRVAITAGRHELIADEGPKLGGQDAGPAPYDLLLSGLGACTAVTLKMYAERKAWPLRAVKVALRFHRDDAGEHIFRTLALDGDLDAEQQASLADIAERTPVTLTLKHGLAIHTSLASG